MRDPIDPYDGMTDEALAANIAEIIGRNRPALARLGGRCPDCNRPMSIEDDRAQRFLCWRCDPDYTGEGG